MGAKARRAVSLAKIWEADVPSVWRFGMDGKVERIKQRKATGACNARVHPRKSGAPPPHTGTRATQVSSSACRSNAGSKVNFTKSGNGPPLKFISCPKEPRNLTVRPPKCVLFRLPWASSSSPYTPPLRHVRLDPALLHSSLRDAPLSINPTIQYSAVPRSRTSPCVHKHAAQRRPCA